MLVRRASTLGFCGGVRRAILLSESTQAKQSWKSEVKTLGDIIHNQQEIDRLSNLGIGSVSTIAEVEESNTIVIRAHGATKSDYEQLKSKRVPVVEGTCPLVQDIRNKIKDYSNRGYFIILTGEANHSEVKGLISFTDNGVILSNLADAYKLEVPPKSILISQSTWRRDRLLAVYEILKSKNSELILEDTVCAATIDRQKALVQLISSVEAVIIVGSNLSANSQELLNLALESGIPAWLCNSCADLADLDLSKFSTIGLSAGASAPDWLIDEIEARLELL